MKRMHGTPSACFFAAKKPEHGRCSGMAMRVQKPKKERAFSAQTCLTSVAGFEVGPEMISMMGGFTVIRLFTMMGSMANLKFTKEELLDLNAKHNKIKKKK